MRKKIGRLCCVIAFAWLWVAPASYVPSAKVSVVASAAAMVDDGPWQCGASMAADTVNVRCPPYNAIPDDDRNDWLAFQRAVDGLPASGGTVVIPAGTYLLDAPLVITKPIRLEGAGAATVVTHRFDMQTDGGNNLIKIGGAATVTENVVLRNFTLRGPLGKDLRTPVVRLGHNVKGMTIRDMFFSHISSTCILLLGTNIQNVQIFDNRAEEFYEQFVELASGGISDVRIERNVVKATRSHPKLGAIEPYGVMFEPKISGEIANVTIVDNKISFDGMGRNDLINTGGISLQDGNPPPYLYRNILVQGNEIHRVGVGIKVQTLRAGRVSGPGSVTIRNNLIVGAQSHGIQVHPASDNSWPDAVSIIDNTVRGYSEYAFYQYDGIRLEGAATKPEIIGNQVLPLRNGASDSGRYGISTEPDIKMPVIKNNKIAGFTKGATSIKSSVEKIAR